MIKLSSCEYTLKGVTKEHFWKELDSITVGQNMNPEFGYTTQYFAKFDNIFAGRKTKDNFSIYLYRPIFKGFRTEILSKGQLFEDKDGIRISCSFEIPFWSTLVFLVMSFILFTPVLLRSFTGGMIFALIGIGIYSAIVQSNHNSIKKEVKKQFERIEKTIT
ncbi:MAG TPA: hypothetical protein VEP89_14075 [Draconibacterium sp.]|nr:hypothetical protein [Draconibacterium sp.]